jgi:hypothetical protein
MNNFFKTIVLLFSFIALVSCDDDDNNSSSITLRDYSEQYETDIANIEDYLKTHYIEVVNNPGATNDQDVTYTLIPEGGTQTSIWDQTEYPLLTHYVKQNDIVYKVYYLELRQGTGTNSKSPCNVDEVLTSYRGEYMYTNTETVDGVEVKTVESTQFEELIYPENYFNLAGVIRGWSEIFPKFKTGNYLSNSDGTLSYINFGAGVMFLPSGLAYYGSSTGGIPAYSPLIFSIKLYEVNRTDNDNDGVFSYQEDLATSIVNSDGTETLIEGVPDGYVRISTLGEDNPDDTDGDGTPDFLDNDDDGDFFTTKSEINNQLTDEPFSYELIPDCSGDFTSENRLRRHRDPSCSHISN